MIQSFFKHLMRPDRRSHQSNRSERRKSGLSIDWILPGQLAVGRLPRAADRDALRQAGVKTILALCSESEGGWSPEVSGAFRCMRYVLPDSHYLTKPTAPQIATAVTLVHQSIERSEPIFVHCLAGIERSPSICAAYLCRYQNVPLWQALDWVKQVHPESMPNELQIQAIRDYLEQHESWSDRIIA